jgi:hypothetical protein
MWHKHPDDRPKIAAALDHVRRTHEPMSTRHRIVDTKGHTREVIVLGEHLCDDTGAQVGIHGFYVDVTPTHRKGSVPDRAYDQLVSGAVREIAESRGRIEQVKGVLMFVYRIDEEQAWDLLKWRSLTGFNRWTQHLDDGGVFDGTTTGMGSGVDGAGGDALTGAAAGTQGS